MELRNSVIVITGAGSGIGRALALTFGREGANVVCCGRRLERLQAVVAEIEAFGGQGLAVAVDITEGEEVKHAVAQVYEKYGHIDVLFNNAGSFNCIGALHEVDPEDWWNDVTINLKGSMLMMQQVLPDMMKRDSGVIINMNGGRTVGGSGYAAGKAGVMEMAKVCSNELKQLGSNVILLGAGPGLVQTEMTELQANSEAGRKWIPSTIESIESGDLRSPFDIANKTIEVLKAVVPEWSGKYFGPDTDLAEFDLA